MRRPSQASLTGTSDAVAPRARPVMRWIMVAFYGLAGIAHLTLTDKFLLIVPDWVPLPRAVVLATGICEIAGSVALAGTRFRRLAGIMLSLYAVCVYPANVKHAIEGIDLPSMPSSWWYHGPRLAFQPVLVWWALFCAGVIDWPFRASTIRAGRVSVMPEPTTRSPGRR